MRIPIEKSIYRRVYLQLKTGFLTERPLFYDAVRITPPPVFIRPSEKLPNLGGMEDRLIKKFQKKYPYNFEDFVSDHSDSTRYVAYNFAKRQMQLMNMGQREDVAFRIAEKEFLAELDAINAQLFDEVPPATQEEETKGVEKDPYKNESVLHRALRRELTLKQKETMQKAINRIITNYKTEHGNHIISRRLSALEHLYDEREVSGKPAQIPKSDFVYDYSFSNSDYSQEDMEDVEDMENTDDMNTK